jgi:hypothetical protein
LCDGHLVQTDNPRFKALKEEIELSYADCPEQVRSPLQ